MHVCAGMAGRHETESRFWAPALTHPVIRLMQKSQTVLSFFRYVCLSIIRTDYLYMCLCLCVGQIHRCIVWALRYDICVWWKIYQLLQLRHINPSSLLVLWPVLTHGSFLESMQQGLAPPCCDAYQLYCSIYSDLFICVSSVLGLLVSWGNIKLNVSRSQETPCVGWIVSGHVRLQKHWLYL